MPVNIDARGTPQVEQLADRISVIAGWRPSAMGRA